MSERTSFEGFVRELERDEDFKVLLDEARQWFSDDDDGELGAGVPRKPVLPSAGFSASVEDE